MISRLYSRPLGVGRALEVQARQLLQQVLHGEEEVLRFLLLNLVKGLPNPFLTFVRLEKLYQSNPLSAKETVSYSVVQCPTHRGLCILVKHVTEDKDGDVVLSEIREYGIGNMSNLAALDLQSGLLQRLSLGTLHEIFTILKVPTWESPLSLIMSKVSE